MSDETKDKIHDTALNLFTRFGFKRVTMEDLSKQMAISKKTIYKFFLSKDQLLESIIEWKKNYVQGKVDSILEDNSLDFKEKLNRILKFVTKEISHMHVEFLQELQYHRPELWEKMQEFKKESIFKFFKKMVRQGIDSGYFREDIDDTVFTTMYYQTVLNIMTPQFLSTVSYTSEEIYRMIIKVYFHGLIKEEKRQEFQIESLK